ncbi:acyl-CoA-binding domain-containing protein 7 isoform X1 [Symphalangus syndactylus]|uniref:acyl-CoA-binding domain-containing protein 7 isoform X1 n=1 Tax=Symphalangus syndactylus TaxID=9590 RepID=UPI0030052953
MCPEFRCFCFIKRRRGANHRPLSLMINSVRMQCGGDASIIHVSRNNGQERTWGTRRAVPLSAQRRPRARDQWEATGPGARPMAAARGDAAL